MGHLQIHLQQTSLCLDDIQHREALEVFLVKSIEAQPESDMTEGGCCSWRNSLRGSHTVGGALTYLGTGAGAGAQLHLRTSARPKLPCCASQILFTAPSILLLPPVLLSETLNCDQLLFPCYSVASCTLGLEDGVLCIRFSCCLSAVLTAESTSATALWQWWQWH